ncbi:MAG TPA: DNA-directed RNA polymerase subunit alpha C-terminal domain-containing protein [Desulfosporosinus sp.]|nr:DNA-directed RNA polymerase subunit alpha C-terminal domain-containing protein [Desulfosporosinus sp.]
MVQERVITQYACEYCQRQYIDMETAERCEKRCHRHADSPEIGILNLSPRAYNTLYYGDIETISELEQHSEEELSELNGLGRVTRREIRDKLAEYQANE